MTQDRLILHPRVEIQKRETVYQGYFHLDRYHLRHQRHNGDWTEVFTREVFERGHAAGVLLYDPVQDKVALIEQYRVGAQAAGWEPWLYEVVAGIIDEGETPEIVARREAVEEAGCPLSDLIPIIHYLVTPGGSSESVALYCALVDSSNLGGTHGLEAEHEDIQVHVMSSDEAIGLLSNPRAANSMLIISLQWLALNRDRLRAASA